MRAVPRCAAALLALCLAAPVHAGLSFEYLSPRPDARMVSAKNNIIIRSGEVIDRAALPAPPAVYGNVSGLHDGSWILAGDDRTLIFKPGNPFTTGEMVSVSYSDPRGGTLDYSFQVSAADPLNKPQLTLEQLLPELQVLHEVRAEPLAGQTRPLPLQCDTLASDVPWPTIHQVNNPDPGYLFIVPFARPFAGVPGHLMVMDNAGELMFYRKVPPPGAIDFKLLPNGYLTYFDRRVARYMLMDSTYTVVDSVEAGNGYVTDLHDLVIHPETGNYLVMIYDAQPVDMDSVSGGDPNAVVVGLVIQEIDQDRNVVFQWRSWDDMPITDTVFNLNLNPLDYVHGNAFEYDYDGHILVSSRSLHEITKIDRTTGLIIWRMGLNAKRNEFTFMNDPRGYYFMHDIRRLPNGNVTLYDNGNGSTAPYSRAVEYRLDEVAKTATQVWEYRHVADVFSPVIGNVQRRANGSTLIDWGLLPGDTLRATDLHADGTIALEFGLPHDVISYRAFRFPFRTTRFSAPEALDFGALLPGQSTTRMFPVTNTSSTPVTITCITGGDSSYTVSATLPRTLSPGEQLMVSVDFAPVEEGSFNGKLYVRAVENNELIATDVAISGRGAPDLGGQALQFTAVGPNPFNNSTSLSFALAGDTHVKIEIFDISGRLVDTIVDNPYLAGRHSVTWSAPGRDPGVYWARIDAAGTQQQRRLLLVK